MIKSVCFTQLVTKCYDNKQKRVKSHMGEDREWHHMRQRTNDALYMDWSRPLKNTNDSRYIYGKHSVQHSGTSHSNRGLALFEQSAQRSSKLPPPTPLRAHTLAGIEPEN